MEGNSAVCKLYECKKGQSRCVGYVIQECDSYGRWGKLKRCTSAQDTCVESGGDAKCEKLKIVSVTTGHSGDLLVNRSEVFILNLNGYAMKDIDVEVNIGGKYLQGQIFKGSQYGTFHMKVSDEYAGAVKVKFKLNGDTVTTQEIVRQCRHGETRCKLNKDGYQYESCHLGQWGMERFCSA